MVVLLAQLAMLALFLSDSDTFAKGSPVKGNFVSLGAELVQEPQTWLAVWFGWLVLSPLRMKDRAEWETVGVNRWCCAGLIFCAAFNEAVGGPL